MSNRAQSGAAVAATKASAGLVGAEEGRGSIPASSQLVRLCLMLRTRQEIASLLKKAEGNLKKTQEIHRELQSLMDYIESVLTRKKPSLKHAPPR